MKALLILDIQKDFTLPNGRFPVDSVQACQVIIDINALVINRSSFDIVPVYIGNEFSLYDPRNLFRNFCSIKGTEGCAIDDRLKVVNNNYFSKGSSDAFTNHNLGAFLRKNKIDEVYLAGLYAESCVLATARSAKLQGFKVSVLIDCIATSTGQKREKVIKKYTKAQIDIISTAILISQIS